MDIFAQWPAWTWIAMLAATLLAAVAHGVIGFGFPLISTPLVALFTDVRTAVLTTLLPNLVINVISIVRGADWIATLRQFWPMAAYVLLGTIGGTRILAYAEPRYLKLMLAGMIFAYLLQARLRGSGWKFLKRFPRLCAPVFGLLGGFFSGSVNVAVPPLLVYFSSLELPPIVMTQALNLSFFVGRSTQAVALVSSGQLGVALVLLSVPLSAVLLLALGVGFRLQGRIEPEQFGRLVRATLWAMAAILSGQVALGEAPQSKFHGRADVGNVAAHARIGPVAAVTCARTCALPSCARFADARMRREECAAAGANPAT